MILKDETEKMKKENIIRYTYRPYPDFDSYVETYKKFKGKIYSAVLNKPGSFGEALVYVMHKGLSKGIPTIIGNGFFHDEGAKEGTTQECFLSIPLNGIKFLNKITYSNIIVDGTPSEYRYNNEKDNELKWKNLSFLDTYMNFCNVKNVTSSMINLEYGDYRFLFHPILSIIFKSNINDFYINSSQFIFNVYGLIRYHQYKLFGRKLNFDFNKNHFASGVCTLLAHPHFEYKILLPSNYSLLGNEFDFSEKFFNDLTSLLNITLNKKEKLISVFKTYEEFWELILINDYELAFIKVLSFLEYFFNCKRMYQVSNKVANNINLKNYDKISIIDNIDNLIEIRKKIVHEAYIQSAKKLNYSKFLFKDIIHSFKKEIYFILDLFDEIISSIFQRGEQQ